MARPPVRPRAPRRAAAAVPIDQASGAALGLGDDRGPESEPVVGQRHDADREHLGVRGMALDQQVAREIPSLGVDNGEVGLGIGARRRPHVRDPLGAGNGNADERLGLRVHHGHDRLRVGRSRRPQPNPGGNGMAAIVAGEGIAPARRTSVTDHDRR